VVIINEALVRFSPPNPINSTVMFVANLAEMYVLRGSHNQNLKSAFLLWIRFLNGASG